MPVNVVLRVLDRFSQDCLGHVRLILLLIELRERASSVESDIVESLYQLTESPSLFQVTPSKINIVGVREEHLTDLQMRSSFDLLRER